MASEFITIDLQVGAIYSSADETSFLLGGQIFTLPDLFGSPHKSLPGIFAVLVPDENCEPQPFRIVYFGLTKDCSRLDQTHPDYKDWLSAARSRALLVSVHYLSKHWNEQRRHDLLRTLIAAHKPFCNELPGETIRQHASCAQCAALLAGYREATRRFASTVTRLKSATGGYELDMVHRLWTASEAAHQECAQLRLKFRQHMNSHEVRTQAATGLAQA